MVNSLGQDWLRSWMPPSLWNDETEDLKKRRVETGSLALFAQDAWRILLQLSVDCILDGRRNPGCRLGLGWPGRGWQGYSSLGVLEGTGSEAEA